MDDLIYKRKARPTPHINWPKLVFYAEAFGEGFEELTIMTLKSYYNSVCQEAAVAVVPFSGDEDVWFRQVQERAEQEMNSGECRVREFVKVDEQMNATVCINADIITDKEIDIALTWLEQADIPGEQYFGEWKTFTAEQIKEIQYNDAYSQ